jgi:hypothetical protein
MYSLLLYTLCGIKTLNILNIMVGLTKSHSQMKDSKPRARALAKVSVYYLPGMYGPHPTYHSQPFHPYDGHEDFQYQEYFIQQAN